MTPARSFKKESDTCNHDKTASTSERVTVPLIPGLKKQSTAHELARGDDSRLIPSNSTTFQPFATPPQSQGTGSEAQLDARQSTYNTKDQPPYIPSGQEQNTFAFDVYARPYVPSWLQSVNEEPAENNVVTEVKHAIRYGAYINKFAGKDFLAQHPSLISEWLRDDVPFVAQLSEQSYIEHFTSLLKRECLARKRVNEQYALYMVSLQAIPTPDGNCLWALSVPGLREDNPLVQMGDDLQIRQIWVDLGGNPIQIPVQMDNAGSTYFVQKSWTGKQYNAAVCSVSRVNETVYLRIDGLAHLFLYPNQNTLPMFVNVVFPLKQRTLQGQLRALQSTGHSLKQTSRGQEDVAITNGFSAFSESLLQIDESSSHRVPSAAPRNDWMRRMLFPTNLDGQLQTQLRGVPHRALFDHAINYEQAHAVNSICATDYGTLPYLISGPPGTGKTKTLVEIAMQLLNTTDVVHMLVCAPSEAAADTLAIRLKQYLTPKQLLRLNGPNRADNEVPRELMQYCYIQNDMFYLPPFKKLMSFSVVVTSCRDAAMLAEARLTNADLWSLERDIVSTLHPEEELPTPSLHWGALLLDEAAQATEVDALPAISVVCPPSGYRQDRAQPRLVMAGDENQLGPRTASHDPQFATSLFARLFSRPLFAKHPLSRSNVKPSSGPPVLKRSMLPILYPPFTNLIRNYRSHPAILSVPSSRFYHDTLIPEAPITHTPLQASSLWRGRKWPVLYIPHIGTDEIERDNGGWYNISEARLACSLARTLVYDSAVRQQDICIMSPFAAQVKILRSMIRSHQHGGGNGLWDVNIGPVEAFQGLEKRVVIICTTRTRTRFVENDVKMEMGLVGQKQKMNVALTRAKEALFVIGSPEVLGGDEHWRDWMAYCLRNGLVDDPHGVWKDKEEFRVGKVGVLERALVAREEGQREKQWPALGAGAAEHDIDGGEYEAFAESLRQALEEEDLEDYEEEEDDTLEHEATEL